MGKKMFTLHCPKCHSKLDTIKFLSTSRKVRRKEKHFCPSCNTELSVNESRYTIIFLGWCVVVLLPFLLTKEPLYRIFLLLSGTFLYFGLIIIPLTNKFVLGTKVK